MECVIKCILYENMFTTDDESGINRRKNNKHCHSDRNNKHV